MSAIIIAVSPGIQPGPSGDDVFYSGQARCEDMTPSIPDINWATDPMAPTSTATQINNAVRDAAVAAAAANDPSYTVGALESKIILGGAIGLL